MTRFRHNGHRAPESVIWAQPDVDTEDDVILLNGKSVDRDDLDRRQEIVGLISTLTREGRPRQSPAGATLYVRRGSAATQVLTTTAQEDHPYSPLVVALVHLRRSGPSPAEDRRPVDDALVDDLVTSAQEVAAGLGRALDDEVAEDAVRELVSACRSRWARLWARIYVWIASVRSGS